MRNKCAIQLSAKSPEPSYGEHTGNDIQRGTKPGRTLIQYLFERCAFSDLHSFT